MKINQFSDDHTNYIWNCLQPVGTTTTSVKMDKKNIDTFFVYNLGPMVLFWDNRYAHNIND